jgi:hypothetical protein
MLAFVKGVGTVGGAAVLTATLAKGTTSGGVPDFSSPVPVEGEFVEFFLTFTGSPADKFSAVSASTGSSFAATDPSGVAILPDVLIPTGSGSGTLTGWVIARYAGNPDPTVDLAAAADVQGPLDLSPDPSNPPATDSNVDPNLPADYGPPEADPGAGLPGGPGVDPYTGQPAADPYTGVADIDPYTGRPSVDPFSGQPMSATDVGVRDFINKVFSQPPVDLTGIPQDVQDAIFDAFSQPAVDLSGVPQDVQGAIFDAFSQPGVDSDVVDAIYRGYSRGETGGVSPLAAPGRTIAPPPPVSGPDYTLFVPHGFVWQGYETAYREAWNPDNPTWARITFGALAVLSAPLAGAEEYIGRSILNIPFALENAGLSIGEHIGRATLWAEQGEYAEATAEGLESVTHAALGFTVGASAALPVAGAIEQGVAARTLEARLAEGADAVLADDAAASSATTNAARNEAAAAANQVERQTAAPVEQVPEPAALPERAAAPPIEQSPSVTPQLEKSTGEGFAASAPPQSRVLLVGAENELEIANAYELQARGSDVTIVNPELSEAALGYQQQGGRVVQSGVQDLAETFDYVHENYPQPYVNTLEAIDLARARMQRVSPGGVMTVITENPDLVSTYESAAYSEGMTFSQAQMTTALPASEWVSATEPRYLIYLTRPK